MAEANQKQKLLTNWGIALTSWKAQIMANLLFGFPLLTIFLFSSGANIPAIKFLILLYCGILAFVYAPIYGTISILLLRKTKKLIKNIDEKETGTKDVALAIKNVLNFSFNFSVIIFFSTLIGVSIIIFIIAKWFLPIFIIRTELFILCGCLMGFVVALVHAFLNYIYFENHLRKTIEFLSVHSPRLEGEKIIFNKRSLFTKIFFVVACSVIIAQFSIITAFLMYVGMHNAEQVPTIILYSIITVVFTLFFIFITALRFTEHIVYPIKKIIQWTENIRKGNKTERDINLITNDETWDLINYIQDMVLELEEAKTSLEIKVGARTKELKELADGLEDQVKKRTKELQEKIQELEKFQSVVVGRELKMIELKKEIERLKGNK